MRNGFNPAKAAFTALAALAAFAGTARAADGNAVATAAADWAAVGAPAAGAATVFGGYAGGCMQGAAALPPEGPGYQAIRLSRKRNYGHPALIRYLQDLGLQAERQGLGVMMIGDMSQPRGGPMPNGHASHQIGLDADVWLRLDQPRLSRAEREAPTAIKYVDYSTISINETAWTDRQARLIRLAASDPRVGRVFINPVIKQKLCLDAAPGDRAWLAKVRPWWGHDAHVHVRLNCPAGSPECVEQAALPPGDGCGEEVESWLADMAKPAAPAPQPPPAAKPRTANVPKACMAVLKSRSGVRPAALSE